MSNNTGIIRERDPAEEAEILQKRARVLAKVSTISKKTGDDLPLLIFLLSGEKYGVEMEYVKEVSLLKSLTTLPGTPNFLLGIISLRGRIISITDLRVFFSLPRKGLSDYNKIILLSYDRMEFAILADHVEGMQIMDSSKLIDPPPTISGIGKEYIRGILPGSIIVINTVRLMGDQRLIVSTYN